MYLIQIWQLFMGLLLHHAPMGGPRHWDSPLGCSRRLPSVAWYFPLSWSRFAEDRVVLSNISWWSGLSLFIFGHFFFLGMAHGLDMKWAGVANSFGPTILYIYISYRKYTIFKQINNPLLLYFHYIITFFSRRMIFVYLPTNPICAICVSVLICLCFVDFFYRRNDHSGRFVSIISFSHLLSY